MTAQNQPVPNQVHQHRAAAVIKALPTGDDAAKGAVARLGSATGSAAGGVGMVEQSGTLDTSLPRHPGQLGRLLHELLGACSPRKLGKTPKETCIIKSLGKKSHVIQSK